MTESTLQLPARTPAVNISARHHYRFGYLKSEHWSNLRLEKLASVDAVCAKCGMRDLSNDVHHLNYRKLYDVTVNDLVVLCRNCHIEVHEYLDRSREGYYEQPDAPNQWGDFLKLWNGNPGGLKGMGNHIKALKESREEFRRLSRIIKPSKVLKILESWNAYCENMASIEDRTDYSI